eukprot:5794-Heterococcus_DN1.PRE.1
MSSSSTAKRTVMSASSPLDDAGILLHILNILGPGHHLFISAVSKAWREGYEKVASVRMSGLHAIASQTTLWSAAFASASRVILAHECGSGAWRPTALQLGVPFHNLQLHRIAGRVADVPTLRAALELGLALIDELLLGAAEAQTASVLKLQWLHIDKGCRLRAGICDYAAEIGSVDTLRWLKDHGCLFNSRTCERAAASAHVSLLQYLHDEGCEWTERVCASAADVATLKWLHEHFCPWNDWSICGDAAEVGSIEMLVYLKQQGCEYSDDTMHGAARRGQLAVCQYLVAEQCPSDIQATDAALRGGHFKIVRLLHQNGCPWNPENVCYCAARLGSIEMLQYLQQQGFVFDVTTMCIAADHLLVLQYLHAEQCPWDERVCRSAAGHGHVDTLRWLHEQGCPWDIQEVRCAAASSGDLPVISYVMDAEPAASAAQLTEMLNAAGSSDHLAVAQWMRQQGVEWPAVLKCGWTAWPASAVQWARDEG